MQETANGHFPSRDSRDARDFVEQPEVCDSASADAHPKSPTSRSISTKRPGGEIYRLEPDPISVSSVDYGDVRIISGRVSVSTKTEFDDASILQDLRSADRFGLKRRFCKLSPPCIDSLAGEYDGELLDQGGPIRNALTKRMFGIHGSWLGKAFYPVGGNNGVGYNLFSSSGTVLRKLPMDTTIAESIFDQGLSLKISYRAKNLGIITRLLGEVRQVTPNVLLGIGIFGPNLGCRDGGRRKIPFLLVGPRRPYQHESMNRGDAGSG